MIKKIWRYIQCICKLFRFYLTLSLEDRYELARLMETQDIWELNFFLKEHNKSISDIFCI